MANEILMSMSQDEVELAHFRSRRMFQMDVDHGLAVSRREGIEIGIERVARSMLADNEPLDKIARYTGLSQSEIEICNESRSL